ncbi:unnamed protein product, partial [Prorocentrum cordatum]
VRSKSVSATKYTYLPIAWGDLEPWAQEILESLIPLLKRKSIIFLGERWRVRCLGDGDMSDLSVKVFKSFLGASCMESLARERWCASKFVQCQPRMMAADEFDASLGPAVTLDGKQVRAGAVLGGAAGRIANETFMKMVGSAPPPCSEADLEAIVKRVNVFVNAKHYVRVRILADPEVHRVQLKRDQGESFFAMTSELADQPKRNPIDVSPADELASEKFRAGDGASSSSAVILIENGVFLERSAALVAGKECVEDDRAVCAVSIDDEYESFMGGASADAARA